MKKEKLQYIIDTPIGSAVTFFGEESKIVTGKFHDRYVSPNGVADAYVLAFLDPARKIREELGAEKRQDEWYLWRSGFVRTYSTDDLRKVLRGLKCVERGTAERISQEGIGCDYHPRYVFEKRHDAYAFLGLDSDTFDVWSTEEISPSKITIKLPETIHEPRRS